MERLAEKLQAEDLGASYDFIGRTAMDVPKAIEVKAELETIDRPLEQFHEALKNAKIVVIDMEALKDFLDDASVDQLWSFQEQVEEIIRQEYPGDVLRFFEAYSIAKHVDPGRVVELMPKPVTIREPVVRLRADLSDPNVSEAMIPPHFTNIQHALRLARQTLVAQDTPNRQVMLITDGLPTAHFEGEHLYLLYPPDPLTERATMREAMACHREGITINIFLIPSWSQTSEDVQFAHRLAETTKGRVFFTGGEDLDRFVLWDYVSRRRRVIG